MNPFKLDPRLDADTLPVLSLALCDLRLMNDRRWPWLILAPRVADACEVHDLSEGDQIMLAKETAFVAAGLKRLTQCEKINNAAIGNIVRQLHVHVIARTSGDANWPGPVWGFGAREVYQGGAARAFAEKLRDALSLKIL